MPIREDLNFNAARIHDELFDEHPVVAEGRLRLRAGARQTLAEFALRMGNAHALAAPARRGLDHDGIADLGRDFCGLRVLGDDAKMAGNGGNIGLCRGLLALDLVAHGGHGRRVRADEHDADCRQCLGKRRAFRKKTVARMHRLGAAPPAGIDDFFDREIALRGRRRADRYRQIRHLDVERIRIRVGIDRNGFDPHAARGLDDSTGDLAAIGDQDTLEHAANGPRERA